MLLLLNRITMADRGMVAPGHLLDARFEDPAPFYDAGAIFLSDAAGVHRWQQLVDDSTAMRLRGTDWGEIERMLVGFAGDLVASFTRNPMNHQCNPFAPPPPVIRPCNLVPVWVVGGFSPGVPVVLMRGAQLGTRLFWAGTMMTDGDEPERSELLALDYEFVEKGLTPSPALAFAEAAERSRLTGEWTWEESEEHAAIARLRHAQFRCLLKVAACPGPLIRHCRCNPFTG